MSDINPITSLAEAKVLLEKAIAKIPTLAAELADARQRIGEDFVLEQIAFVADWLKTRDFVGGPTRYRWNCCSGYYRHEVEHWRKGYLGDSQDYISRHAFAAAAAGLGLRFRLFNGYVRFLGIGPSLLPVKFRIKDEELLACDGDGIVTRVSKAIRLASVCEDGSKSFKFWCSVKERDWEVYLTADELRQPQTLLEAFEQHGLDIWGTPQTRKLLVEYLLTCGIESAPLTTVLASEGA
jgi:hypothetical protein